MERRRPWLQAEQCECASVPALNKYLSCQTGTTQPQCVLPLAAQPLQILMLLPPNLSEFASLPPTDAEDTAPTQPDTTPFRLNSDCEAESTPHTYDPITQVVVDMLELEGPRVRRSHPVRRPVKATKPTVEPSGPSHGGTALAGPTPRESQRRFSSDDEGPPVPVVSLPFGQIPTDPTLSSDDEDESEEWIGPRLGLVRRGRGGGHTVRKRTRTRRRLPANPFVQMEAEEGEEEESAAESESPPRGAFASPSIQTLTPSHHSDEDSSDSSDIDEDSSDYYELDNSFLVADDYFE